MEHWTGMVSESHRWLTLRQLIVYTLFCLFIVYFEVYGCQMNVSDTEVAWSILKNVGYTKTADIKEVHFTHTLSQRMCHM